MDFIECLLNNGANLFAETIPNANAMYFAILYTTSEFVKYFEQKNMDIFLRDIDCISALSLASQNKDSEVLNYIISKGADINEWFKNRRAIDYAIEKTYPENVKILVKNGADIFYIDKENQRNIFHNFKNPSQVGILKYIIEFFSKREEESHSENSKEKEFLTSKYLLMEEIDENEKTTNKNDEENSNQYELNLNSPLGYAIKNGIEQLYQIYFDNISEVIEMKGKYSEDLQKLINTHNAKFHRFSISSVKRKKITLILKKSNWENPTRKEKNDTKNNNFKYDHPNESTKWGTTNPSTTFLPKKPTITNTSSTTTSWSNTNQNNQNNQQKEGHTKSWGTQNTKQTVTVNNQQTKKQW